MIELRDHDLAWLAVDTGGRIAVFTTGGQGPIPPSALTHAALSEATVRSLPEVGGHELLRAYARPDDFVAYARRGLYAYDWSDVHRNRMNETSSYELIARPTKPISIDELRPQQRLPFESTKIAGVEFGATQVPRHIIAV